MVTAFEMTPLSLFVCQPLAKSSCISQFTADSAVNTSGSGKNVAWTQMWAATADPAREGQTFKFWPHVLAAKMLARSPFHCIREAENTMLIRFLEGSPRDPAGFP